MVLHHFGLAPGMWLGSTGEMISCRAEVCVYLWGEPPFTCLAGREIIPGSYRLYSQSRSSLYCTLYCCHYNCYSFRFSFLSHSVTVRTYAHSLTLACSLTPYAHIPHAPPSSWKGLHHSYNSCNCRCTRPIDRTWTPSSFTLKSSVWKYFGFPVSYVDNVHIVTDVISYYYIMLLKNVLNLTL